MQVEALYWPGQVLDSLRYTTDDAGLDRENSKTPVLKSDREFASVPIK